MAGVWTGPFETNRDICYGANLNLEVNRSKFFGGKDRLFAELQKRFECSLILLWHVGKPRCTEWSIDWE